MNPSIAKALVLIGMVVMVAIRAPHGRRNRSVRVATSYKTRLETGLLALVWIGFVVPLIWVASPVFSFADFPLLAGPLVTGVICLGIGLWLFYRSHADLGTNWSITLEVHENHRLITQGVYRRIRHPMYLALGLYSSGQALIIPKFGGRSSTPHRIRDPLRVSYPCREKNDDRGLRCAALFPAAFVRPPV